MTGEGEYTTGLARTKAGRSISRCELIATSLFCSSCERLASGGVYESSMAVRRVFFTQGGFQCLCLVEEFLKSFTTNAGINLHVNVPYGTNAHHIAEAIFKGLAKAMEDAVRFDERIQDVPSTKGIL